MKRRGPLNGSDWIGDSAHLTKVPNPLSEGLVDKSFKMKVMEPAQKGRRKKLLLGCLGIGGAILLALVIWLGPVLMAFINEGFFDETEMRSYQGNSADNLKAIHRSLSGFHESEGVLPEAEKWMDDALLRLKSADMAEEESKKMLVSPRNSGKPNQYGYAFNAALSGMYIGDIKDPKKTVLIFESKLTEWNASGDPKTDAAPKVGNTGPLALTVSGEVVPLADLLTPKK